MWAVKRLILGGWYTVAIGNSKEEAENLRFVYLMMNDEVLDSHVEIFKETLKSA